MLLDTVKTVTQWLATMAEGVGALVIAVAVIDQNWWTNAPAHECHGRRGLARSKEEVRLRLGRWLALALEFELGADILRTAVAPTWSEIGQLAAIAAARTALNYFLQQEIDKAAQRRSSAQEREQPVDQ